MLLSHNMMEVCQDWEPVTLWPEVVLHMLEGIQELIHRVWLQGFEVHFFDWLSQSVHLQNVRQRINRLAEYLLLARCLSPRVVLLSC